MYMIYGLIVAPDFPELPIRKQVLS